MSSNYRDVGEDHASTFRMIPDDVESLSIEEMRSLLRLIRKGAADSYADYAVFMGWHDNREEAINSLSASVVSDTPGLPSSTSLIEVTNWFAQQRGIPTEISTSVYAEKEKAYLTDYNWIPKSQIVSIKDEMWREFVPQECVPWFESVLDVGYLVRLVVDDGLGACFNVDGIVEQIDSPEIYVNNKRYLMRNVMQVIRFVDKGDDHGC